jgi:hypothetical protein
MKRWNKWVQHGVPLGIVLGVFACSAGNTAETTGAGGDGGTGAAAQASSSTSSVASNSVASSSSVAVGAGGFGGGSMAFVCDPPAEPGSLYENAAKSYDINDIDAVSMCKYRGTVLLIVNTAAV